MSAASHMAASWRSSSSGSKIGKQQQLPKGQSMAVRKEADIGIGNIVRGGES